MILSNQTQDINFTEDINELLWDINNKLAEVAMKKMEASRYGAKDLTNTDTFFILSRYRDILLKKANKHSCLSVYSIDDIISNIRQYLTTGKIQKFKNCQ